MRGLLLSTRRAALQKDWCAVVLERGSVLGDPSPDYAIEFELAPAREMRPGFGFAAPPQLRARDRRRVFELERLFRER